MYRNLASHTLTLPPTGNLIQQITSRHQYMHPGRYRSIIMVHTLCLHRRSLQFHHGSLMTYYRGETPNQMSTHTVMPPLLHCHSQCLAISQGHNTVRSLRRSRSPFGNVIPPVLRVSLLRVILSMAHRKRLFATKSGRLHAHSQHLLPLFLHLN